MTAVKRRAGMSDLLGKVVPKFPEFANAHWDVFLGLCFVLFALIHGDTLTKNNAALPFGFALIFLNGARRNWSYVEWVRLMDSAGGHVPFGRKFRLAWTKVLGGTVYLGGLAICLHYAARNFGITAPWVRWILHY